MPIPISVVIPAYNRADLIGETLDAILSQSLAPHEVIVVDDGSRDATPAVLAGFGARISAIRIENSGELVARNTGIRAATGALIAFCDSDDLWQPEHLATLAAIWAREPATNAAWANFRLVRDGIWQDREKFDDAPPGFWDGLERAEDGTGLFRQPLFRRLVAFMPFFPSATVVRADFMRARGGWDEAVNRRMSMDIATTMRIADTPPIGVSFAPTVGIRKHASNFSGDVEKMNLGDAVMLEYLLANHPPAATHAAAIRESVARRRLAALDSAYARGDFAAVAGIRALLGDTPLPARSRLKTATAALPAWLRGPVVGALTALGSLRGR